MCTLLYIENYLKYFLLILGLLRDLSHTYKLSFLTSGVIIILSGLGMFFWPCLSTTNKKKINDIDNDK